MANLKGIISSVVGGASSRRRGAGTRTGTAGTTGTAGAAGGRRSQDEAIGRGVRSLLSRFRR